MTEEILFQPLNPFYNPFEIERLQRIAEGASIYRSSKNILKEEAERKVIMKKINRANYFKYKKDINKLKT